MSRSGYSDECDGWALIRWRGAVNAALKGKRGQAFLRETLAALDAMPVKELAADSLANAQGQFCTLGAVGAARGLDMANIDPECRYSVAAAFGIAEAMAAEIMYLNDEVDRSIWIERPGPVRDYWESQRLGSHRRDASGEERWRRMREWVAMQIEVQP